VKLSPDWYKSPFLVIRCCGLLKYRWPSQSRKLIEMFSKCVFISDFAICRGMISTHETKTDKHNLIIVRIIKIKQLLVYQGWYFEEWHGDSWCFDIICKIHVLSYLTLYIPPMSTIAFLCRRNEDQQSMEEPKIPVYVEDLIMFRLRYL